MGSYKDASEEHDSSGVVHSKPNSYDEKLVGLKRYIHDDESPVVIQHEKHMVDHESVEEDDVHGIHGEPSREGW